MDNTGIKVGEPLREFHGILTGTPVLKDNAEQQPLRAYVS
jgi:hypothetical protein